MRVFDPERLAQKLEKTMEEDRADGRVGGTALCVMQSGKPIYKKYFGTVSANSEKPVDASTIYRLASMTKPITTVAALMMVDKGYIDLDEPISRFIPAFEKMNVGKYNDEHKFVFDHEAKTPLTLRILLSHSGGLMSGAAQESQFSLMTDEDKKNLESVVAFDARSLLSFEPKTAQEYSSLASFDVAARLVEMFTDTPFDEFLRKNIFAPCNMTDTTFAPTEEQWGRMITMHNRTSDGKSVDFPMTEGCVFGDLPTTWFCGGAGLASTLDDYVNFAEMLLNKGIAANGERIVSEKMIKEMSTAQVPVELMGEIMRWGLGVRVITADYHMPLGSFGWSGAYGTHFWVDPQNELTAVYMKNSAYDGGACARTARVYEEDIYLG